MSITAILHLVPGRLASSLVDRQIIKRSLARVASLRNKGRRVPVMTRAQTIANLKKYAPPAPARDEAEAAD
jgi:hypothetical protein